MKKKLNRILCIVLVVIILAGIILSSIQIANAQDTSTLSNETYINEELTSQFHENFDETLPSDANQLESNLDVTNSSNTSNPKINDENSNLVNTDEDLSNFDTSSEEYQEKLAILESAFTPSVESNDSLGQDADYHANSFRYQNGQNIAEESYSSPISLFGARASYNPTTPDGRSPTANAIDVSKWQGNINWNLVKSSGLVDFAILRVSTGWTSHLEGDSWVCDTADGDSKFKEYAKQCEALGIPIGGYVYSYADSVADAKREAELALAMLQGVKIDYPIYYDLEDNITATQSASTIAEIAKVFCDTLSSAGYQVGVYANKYWFTSILTDPYFSTLRQWVAQYNTSSTYNGNYEMWQYTSTGRVNGINGNVDLDFWYGDKPGSTPKINTHVNTQNDTITVTATNVPNTNSLSFPVWTSHNDQDDIIWYNAKKIGLNTWSAVIPISNHNYERGEYNIHAYINNNQTGLYSTKCIVNDITCSSVSISKTNDANKSINININNIVSSRPLSQVNVAIWSDNNGQDDLIWYSAKKTSGNNYTVNFKPLDHKLDTGSYSIHVYAGDDLGFYKSISTQSYNMSSDIKPTISALANYTNKTIDISINTPIELQTLSVPVWSDKNDQDDIVWYSANKVSKNQWNLTVPIVRHNNDSGNYSIHLYSTHNNSQFMVGSTSVKYEQTPTINIKTESSNLQTGEFKITIDNIGDTSYISSILVPVWSVKDTQDDLIWYVANNDGNGKYSLTIDPLKHQNDNGVFNINVYAKLKNDITVFLGSASHEVVSNVKPTINVSPNTQHSAIDVKITNLSANKVNIAVWSTYNDQDDLIWYSAKNNGNNSWALSVPITDHNNELGEYYVHIYHDNDIFLHGTTVTLDSMKIENIYTSILDENSGLFKVYITGVTSPSPITSVLVPIWSDNNGQDDLIWYTAKNESNGTYSVTVDPANHKNSTGSYSIHVYGIDTRNTLMPIQTISHTVTNVLPTTVTSIPDTKHENILVTVKCLYDAKNVLIPAWTSSNGQDDIIWYSGKDEGNGTWSVKIPISNHNNETGEYNIHTYYTDYNDELKGISTFVTNIKGNTVDSITAVTTNTTTGEFKVTIKGVSSPAGVKNVQVPVWSDKNGQDDIIWYTAKKESDGTYSVTVNPANHKSNTGTYSIHVYVTDNRNIFQITGSTSIDV